MGESWQNSSYRWIIGGASYYTFPSTHSTDCAPTYDILVSQASPPHRPTIKSINAGTDQRVSDWVSHSVSDWFGQWLVESSSNAQSNTVTVTAWFSVMILFYPDWGLVWLRTLWLQVQRMALSLTYQTMPRWARTSDSSECLNWPTGPTYCFPSTKGRERVSTGVGQCQLASYTLST